MAKPHPLLQTLGGSLGFLPFLGFLLLLAAPPLAAVSAAAADGGIHDLLRDHGLPVGLLPKAVRSFTLDPVTGLLEVELDRPCYARYDNPVFFDRVVAGNLSYGQLRGVVGLSQEELFLWLPVKGIVVSDPSSGVILLDIGVAHKQLSLSLFEEPPDCRPAVGAERVGVSGSGSGLKWKKGREEKGPQDQR